MGRRSGNVTPPHAEGSDGADDAQSGKLRNFMSRFRGGKSKSKSNRKPETALKTESASSDDNPSPAFVGDFPDFDELGLEPRKLDELAKHALSGNASFVANIVSQDSSGPADSDSGNEKSVIDSVTENDECDTALESASDKPVAVSGFEEGFEEQFKYIRVIDQFLPPPHNAALDVPHFCYIDIIDAAHFY
eukprot:m.182106 g.182106  ORF g.182106 m.182106 type:complete len:191 (+) comp18454_c0_seq2:242-814(+)